MRVEWSRRYFANYPRITWKLRYQGLLLINRNEFHQDIEISGWTEILVNNLIASVWSSGFDPRITGWWDNNQGLIRDIFLSIVGLAFGWELFRGRVTRAYTWHEIVNILRHVLLPLGKQRVYRITARFIVYERMAPIESRFVDRNRSLSKIILRLCICHNEESYHCKNH